MSGFVRIARMKDFFGFRKIFIKLVTCVFCSVADAGIRTENELYP